MGLLGGPWEPFFGQGNDAFLKSDHHPPHHHHHDDKPKSSNMSTTSSMTSASYVSKSDPKRRIMFLFGLFLIFLQCLIQVGNAVLTQYMFEQMDIESPLLMTYVGIAMLMVMLPVEWWNDYQVGRIKRRQQREQEQQQEQSGIDESASFDSLAQDLQRIQSSPSFSTYNCFIDIAKRRADELVYNHSRQWNHRKHFMAACLLTPAMFLSDWLFNASLRNTSVSSSTVLVSIQSVFVFCIASFLKLESSSAMKLIGVLCGIVGTVLTAIHDETNADSNDPDMYTEEDSVLVGDAFANTTKGDILAIMAAIMYATYTIQVRLYCPQNEDLYSLPLLLGYIGLVSVVVTSPIVALTTTNETVAKLTANALGVMLLKGLFDFLVSDYLMFRSIVLTSPTIATVGLGLSIPMAFAADLLLRFTETYDNFSLSWFSCLGAGACLIGFLFVNLDQEDDDEREELDDTDHHGKDEMQMTSGDFQQLEDRRYNETPNRII
ncbi:EamA-like transporter family protein [Nitzschia inconspicua]|uniref:EamA-like transporter family protein n=1 Tax=Nitzschia inconspicua TaxID=303405 RepID=A0A9K3M7T6_9STRA|nr:EamA-like transporter family protein [Nitzschia inconspicua]